MVVFGVSADTTLVRHLASAGIEKDLEMKLSQPAARHRYRAAQPGKRGRCKNGFVPVDRMLF